MQADNQITQNKLYLAIDQGGHASRALVFDARGQVVSEAYQPISPALLDNNRVEYEAESLLSSLLNTITEAIEKLGERRFNVTAAGLATQRSNIACWDTQTGISLSPVISWQDRRNQVWLDQFYSRQSEIHNISGLFLSAHYGASKLRWCMDNIDDVHNAFEHGRLAWGPMASFLIFRLLKERPLLTDPVNASRTLLWSIEQMDWSSELLAMFDLPHEALPRCVPNRYPYGTLRVGDVSIPMTLVTGDQAAAMFAFGIPRADTAYITIGTGAFVQQIQQVQQVFTQPPQHASSLLTSIVHEDEEQLLISHEGTVNGAASALDWVTSNLGLHDYIDKIPQWLATASSVPLFINGVSGLGTPFLKSGFMASFIGSGNDQEKVVAVLESIVFLLQINLEELKSLASAPETIVIGGGLARLDGLCQRLADLSGIPVQRHEDHETTARGLAYLISDCSLKFSHNETIDEFCPQDNTALISRYALWKEALTSILDNDCQ